MNADRIAVICRSFAQAAPQRAAWAAAFDAALSRLNPENWRLFGKDEAIRAQRFSAMLDLIIDRLGRPQRRERFYAALGRRHARQGAGEDHYDDSGAALLIALREVLGERYTEEVEAAWATLYGELVECMIAAARRSAASKPVATSGAAHAGGGDRTSFSTMPITPSAPAISTPQSSHCL
jgi:hemoglobin-like flavoprotein